MLLLGLVLSLLFVCSVNNILSTWRRLCLITVHNAHASVHHQTVTSVSCHLCKCRHCLCFHWENVNVKCRCMRLVCSVVLLVNNWLTIRTLVCGHIDAYLSNHLKMLDNVTGSVGTSMCTCPTTLKCLTIRTRVSEDIHVYPSSHLKKHTLTLNKDKVPQVVSHSCVLVIRLSFPLQYHHLSVLSQLLLQQAGNEGNSTFSVSLMSALKWSNTVNTVFVFLFCQL